MERRIRLIAATGLVAGALAALPAAANGALTLAPSSLTFSQPVGTTSPSQTATLTMTCGGCIINFFTPVVAATPPVFTQTNNCTTLVVTIADETDGCVINVAFAANTAGTVNGTLSTGMGGPTATLTGTGVAPPSTTPASGGTAGKCKKGKKKKKRAAAAKKGCKKRKKKR